MVDRRSLFGASLVAVLTALLLPLVVYLTLGTQWGHEIYLFPYAIGVSALPLVGALLTGRFRLAVTSLLLSGGVFVFIGGVLSNGAWCFQEAGSGSSWYFAYDLSRNVIRYGGPIGTCRAEPNTPLVAFGYLLATIGSIQLLNYLTSPEWVSVDLYSLLDAR